MPVRRKKYKGVTINAFGLPVLFNDEKEIETKKNSEKRNFQHICFDSPFKKSAPKNLIVMYDIPHPQKKERDWFRRNLIKFGYIMIQKSVWVGPSPLPKDFLKYVKEIKLGDKFKSFKLAKNYTR